jgi:hypothetical protein
MMKQRLKCAWQLTNQMVLAVEEMMIFALAEHVEMVFAFQLINLLDPIAVNMMNCVRAMSVSMAHVLNLS